VLLAGVVLDELLGDPARWHPVAGFGRVSLALEQRLWRPGRLAGAVHTAALVGLVAGAVAAATRRHRVLAGTATIWAVLGGRSLRREALRLAALLESGDLEGARGRAPALVGRDPSQLDEAELARAAVESVAENTADAVVASLLWFAFGGPPAAAAHRAANTLDAMVGHRSDRYREFGWAAARFDDAVNWMPARLTALLTIAVGGRARETWRVVRTDGGSHPSPNAGRVEAAFAGALGLRLGGSNNYGGRIEQRPFLGDGRPTVVGDIARAVTLSRRVELAALVLCAVAARR
jgi:adenosylcobinamide-phosphate synthase